MTTRVKLRRDTAANWTATNPILAAGEPGLETDTGKIKYGNGASRWNTIEHTGGDALTNTGAITVQTGDADRWLVRLRKEDETTQPGINTGVVVYSTNYDSEGNVIVLAKIDLTEDNIAAFKFTSAGELIWKTLFNPEDNFYSEGHAAVTPTGDIVFCLGTESTSVTVVKLNGETGAITVSQEVVLGLYFNISSVAVDSTGNIIIAGNDENENEEDQGLIVKLSSTASTILWQTKMAVDNDSTRFRAVAVDFNNDVVVTGTTIVATPDGVNTHEEVIVVAKFAGTDGANIWQKTVALEEVRYSIGFGLSLDSVGNIYVCGTMRVGDSTADNPWGGEGSNAAVVFKMTATGVIAWDRRIGPGPCAWVGVSTAVGSDGDLYVYASTYQRRANTGVNYNTGNYDQTLVLARFNKTTGAVVWQSYFNNPNGQEVPGYGDGPWGSGNTNTLDVFEDRIIIGGTVRLGSSDVDQWNNQTTSRYFTQGFIAQFDTDATKFSVDGWALETSHVPGKLTNTLVATTGLMEQSTPTKTIGTAPSLTTTNTGVSVRRVASKTNTWTFGKDGTFTTPADTNIKLQQTQLGYANMYGVWPNVDDSIWFHSVTHDPEGFAYVLGSDSWGSGFAHIYKFTPEGALVWQRQLRSGTGASFNVTYDTNVYTEVTVGNGGDGYKVGDKIVLNGGDLGGNAGVNRLTITVATLGSSSDGIGSVATVNIESGVAAGSGSYSNVVDNYDNARSEVRSMTFDPVTGNPVIVVSTPTYNGDTFDNEWTETVVLLIDSGSGVVINSTTLSDEGDIYPNDVAVSVTGKLAIVGEKYNEYVEYGAVTPLAGSSIDKLAVAKSDIDAEHYPGEPNINLNDWWITGSNIVDKVQVQSVNQYTGLTTAVRQGSGAEFTVEKTSATTPTSLDTITTAFYDGGAGMLTYGYATNVAAGSAVNTALSHVYYYENGSGGTFTRIGFNPGGYAGYNVSSNGSVNGDTTTAITFTVDGVAVSLTPVDSGGGNYDYAVEGSDAFSLVSKVGQTLAVSFALPGSFAYSVLVTNGGTNYLAGHKIKILGTALIGDENLTAYDPSTYGGGFGAWKITDGADGNAYLIFPQPANSTVVTTQLSVGDTVSIEYSTGVSVTLTTTIAAALGAVPNDPYLATYPNSLGYRLTNNGGITGQPDYNVGSITTGNGTYVTGATPDNDIIITVDGVNQGAIVSVSNSGTPNVAAVGPYTGLTGVNHEVGSGALISINFNAATGANEYWYFNEAGTNYVDGDLVTISGTQFAGGTSPANDFIFNVLGSGGITNIANVTGSVPSTHLLIKTNDNINFADEATFAIKQNLGAETFVWTPDWNKSMGGGNYDYFNGVVWNAAGTSLYAVGTGRYETIYDQALVTKWSSTGTLEASVSINSNQNSDGADYGAVALMADNSIVTVHNMYNAVRDESTEVLVTKLDSNLQIIWQQFIGTWSDDDSWEAPQGSPSVAVDPATDEILVVWEADADDTISDRGIYIVKLDTDGDVVWKRVFGVHESDTQLRDSVKFVSISDNKYTVVGTTDAPNDETDNAMIFTMPLDGTGLGYHGLWWYIEPNDDQVKVMKVARESDGFTPNVNSGSITTTDNVKNYYTDYPTEEFTLFREVVRSEVGGAVEFADGSKQSFSTAIIPQVKLSAGRYTIRAEDSGRHILVETQNYAIIIPNYREVTLPVGFTFTIVNISGNTLTVENQGVDGGEQGSMWFSGGDNKTSYVGINDTGSGQMVTLMKIKEGTTSDDGENHGDIWMIAGADISNNW